MGPWKASLPLTKRINGPYIYCLGLGWKVDHVWTSFFGMPIGPYWMPSIYPTQLLASSHVCVRGSAPQEMAPLLASILIGEKTIGECPLKMFPTVVHGFVWFKVTICWCREVVIVCLLVLQLRE